MIFQSRAAAGEAKVVEHLLQPDAFNQDDPLMVAEMESARALAGAEESLAVAVPARAAQAEDSASPAGNGNCVNEIIISENFSVNSETSSHSPAQQAAVVRNPRLAEPLLQHQQDHAEKQQEHKEQKVERFSKKTLSQHFSTWFAHAWFFEDRGLPIVNNAKNPIRRADYMWNIIWPLIFGSIVLPHDLRTYFQYPDQRYGMTLSKVFFGLPFTDVDNYWNAGASNLLTWGNRLGRDLVAEPSYAFITSLMIVIPVLQRLLQCWDEYFKDKQLAQGAPSVTQAEHAIIWDESLNELHESKQFISMQKTKRRHFFDLIKEKVRTGNVFAKWHALEALANIVYSFDPVEGRVNLVGHVGQVTSELIQRERESAEVIQKEIENIRQKSLDVLHDVSENDVSRFWRTRAKYLLASIGRNKQDEDSWLFWTVTIYQLYSFMRMGEIILQKSRGIYEYFAAQQRCENENMLWRLNPYIANYDCTVCGDWDFVYQGDTKSAQGCLNGLLAQKQTPQFIIQNLQSKNKKQPGIFSTITEIDLSNQDWIHWSLPDFKLLFDFIRSHISKLAVLNLSCAEYNDDVDMTDKVTVIIGFLQSVAVSQVLIRNAGMQAENALNFLQKLKGRPITALDLSGNNIGDASLAVFAENPQQLNLTQLWLANNGIGNDGIAFVASSVLPLMFLDISANSFDDNGLISLSQAQFIKSLQSLDISDNTFSAFGIAGFASVLPGSSLIDLKMVNCGLDVACMQALASSLGDAPTLQILDVSRNPIDNGFVFLAQGLQGSNVTDLIAAKCAIEDFAMQNAMPFFSNTSVAKLDLSDNEFGAQGQKILFETIPSVGTLGFISIAGINFLGNNSVLFANAIQNSPQLKGIDISRCGLEDENGIVIVDALVDTNLESVNLADNDLTEATGQRLVYATRTLLSLDLSFNTMGGCLGKIVAAHPQLQQLIVNDDASITDRDGVAVAQRFVASLPQLDQLAAPTLNEDEVHALVKVQRSPIQVVQMQSCQLSDVSADAFCRLWSLPNPPLPISQLQLTGNSAISAANLNCNFMQTSSASRNAPSISMMLIFYGILILYLLQLLTPITKGISYCAQTFFGKSNSKNNHLNLSDKLKSLVLASANDYHPNNTNKNNALRLTTTG